MLAWVVAILGGLHGTAGAACPALLPGMPPPIDVQAQPHEDAGWRAKLAELNQKLRTQDVSRVRVLFLGDSLMEGWAPLVYQQFYGHRRALNLGVRGDATQTLLWRLAQVPLGKTLRPQLVVLLIGTNNLWPGRNAAEIALGVGAVVQHIQQRTPQSKILLVGLLPRAASTQDPLRQLAGQVNRLIAGCADGKSVFYTEAGRMLLDGQGALSEQVAFDYLHLTWMGYAILAAALEPDIRRLLQEPG